MAKKGSFPRLVHNRYMSEILVCGLVYDCSGIQTVCESQKMTKIENSGIKPVYVEIRYVNGI